MATPVNREMHVTMTTAVTVGWILLLAIRAAGAQYRTQENHTVSACFSTSKVLEARCPPASMVKIVDLFYGHSANGSCSFTPGDCALEDFLVHHCVGRRACDINLPTGDLGRQIPHCRLYSNYMQLTYQCVPETIVHDVCALGILNSQSGYIKTPSYPNNFPPSVSCTSSIMVHPSQRLHLHVVDLDLGSGRAGCSDSLYLQGELRSSTLCGQRGQQKVFTTVRNTLNLTFTSDADGHNKGFWLYYQATPYVPTTTAAPTTQPPPRLMSPGPSLSTVAPPGRGKGNAVVPPGEPTVIQGNAMSNTQEEKRLPLEAIVGGLLGSLLCILLVLLILLIIKRRKEREAIPSSTSTAFLHSKAGGRSGAPYIQNNLAMVDDSPMC